ncbi:MAG TPA: amino acid adenylation domain-containing protein, partial [Thermoanaerobaculia bacterium]|nr:amino acid adenylation domain-containing protein [Thermoanaerobaculia bacterium]
MILPRAGLRLPRVDLAHLPADRREAEARRIVAAEAQRPFDLAAAPLLRALVLRADREQMVLTIHHLVCDGWSHAILFRELRALYQAFAQGEPSPLPELRARYSEVVEAQSRALDMPRLQQQLAYWSGKLAGAAAIEIPADRPRSAAVTRSGALFSFAIQAPLADRLRSVSRGERATLFMLVLAAFQALLQRYSGESDIVVGTAVANRPAAAARSVIGFFVNTLPLRTVVAGDLTARALLGRVRETALGAFAHQEVPFEKIARAWRGAQGMDGSAPFGAFFSFETGLESHPGEGDLDWRVRAIGSGKSEFDLSLTVIDLVPGSGPLACDVEYSDERFERRTLHRLAGHFERLLAGIAEDVKTPVQALPLLTGAERHLQLVERNDTAAGYPAGRCLHELIEEQARRAPDAIAVVQEDLQVSYGELTRRARRLGRHLETLGVGPEVRVGICAERSVEMIVGLLAILGAGGAYVPLDPAYPAERLAFLLEDAGVEVLLAPERLRAVLPSSPARVVCLDGAPPEAGGEGPVRRAPGPRNAAYVIYTSGSTGRPKGVIVEHRSAVSYAAYAGDLFAIEPRDRVLQFASLSFDTSVEEIFPCLARGACLVLRTEAMLDPPALRAGCERHRVTVLDLPTAYWQSLVHLAAEVVGAVSPVRLVIVGGEEASQAAVDAWRRQAGRHVRLLSGYGPTEATVVSTSHEVTDDLMDSRHRRAVPMGFSGRNVRTYVLDPWMQPVPIGVSGEVYIGGLGLARCYHGRPDLTAERFVPDPYGAAGSRLYRTGDLARCLEDGNLEFLGRADHQVKLRGFRIELGEIETLLAGHPEVAQAVVTVREDRPGDRRLVAYVVGREGRRPQAGTLRDLVASKLPEHMVPAAFVELESLPLTPQGKLDRRALPAPEGGTADRGEPVAPRTEAEAVLARIWGEVLGVERVGVEESFFELGGDSILSIQVVARARDAGYQLTLKQIFEERTVAGLARAAGRVESREVEQAPVTGPVPLSPIQSWFFDQGLASPNHFNQAVLLEVRGGVEAASLAGAVRELVRHHDALRLRFERAGSAWRQTHVADGGAGVFARVDLSGVAAERRRGALEAAAARAQGSLDITRGPLLRVVLYDLGTAGERLLIVIHHLAVDGVSWRILLEDLQRAYEQLRAARPVELPAKTTSFQEWSERLSAFARSGEMEAEVAYWTRERLLGVPRLPVGSAGGASTAGSPRSLPVSLSQEETRRLLQEVPGAYRTRIDEVLLAALLAAVSRWTGEERVLVDLEGHG